SSAGSGVGGQAGGGAAGDGDGDASTAGTDAMSICTPNEMACALQLQGTWAVTRCNADGSAVSVVDMCGPAGFCEDGACHVRVCEPDQLFCASNELRRCDALGKSSAVEQTCGDGQTCSARAGACVSACAPDPCVCNGGST